MPGDGAAVAHQILLRRPAVRGRYMATKRRRQGRLLPVLVLGGMEGYRRVRGMRRGRRARRTGMEGYRRTLLRWYVHVSWW